MAADLFESFAQAPVPPPPVELDSLVHVRLNKRLLVGQLLDLALRAMPGTMLQFSQALLGLVTFTLCGKYGEGGRSEKQV